MQPSNIILIGMPGSGKSTIGALLAQKLGYTFVDTDRLIEQIAKRSLQSIVDDFGYLVLRKHEEKVLLALESKNSILSTGGSAVYSEAAMLHLKTLGTIIFLDVEIKQLRQRIGNFETRGLAKRADQTFADLFNERHPLYVKYADITVLGNLAAEAVCEEVLGNIQQKKIFKLQNI